ncbi:hypothetical protein [Curvibacter sp. PAE-UM]|uniref:hypothetical protein n=1 Tax=Curvibacter sp. PAE-UM TaxID=1714344 RepID=UPI000AE3D29C|nr:hypothetical protein [Curvibacter sp. PAE-UM]
MLAKITAKNQRTLPKSVTQGVGATEYLDVQVRDGQIILTPVRIQRGDAVRAAWQSGTLRPLANAATVQEELLADYLPFMQLALAGRARGLVSGDRDLLAVADAFTKVGGCPILSLEASFRRQRIGV